MFSIVSRHPNAKQFQFHYLFSFLSMANNPEKESSGLSVGAIVGIVIAAVAVVALIAGLAYFLFFRKTGRYAVLSTSSISSKALCHARERDSTFIPPSWGWISFSPS